jgi:hypothetical protein
VKPLIAGILDNPKSSLIGLAVLAVTMAFLLGRVTIEQFLTAIGVLTGGGLLAAKDAEK